MVVELGQCELFGDFGIFIQTVLGVTSILTLFLKRVFEQPKRSWRIFILDVSKQGFSAFLAHCLNLFLAVLLQQITKRGDGCIWYFVNLIMDCTIGITLCYLFHKAIQKFAVNNQIEVLKSGLYYSENDPQTDEYIDYRIWVVQLVVWCIIVVLVKIIIFAIQIFYSEELEFWGEYSLADFEGNPKMELIFVMVILPITLNSAQYWVQDNFLMVKQVYIEERKERLAQLELFKIVDNDFVMIDPPMEPRMSRLNRQIEEGVYNIKPQDYNEEGELKEVAIEDISARDGSFFDKNNNMPLMKNQDQFEIK